MLKFWVLIRKDTSCKTRFRGFPSVGKVYWTRRWTRYINIHLGLESSRHWWKMSEKSERKTDKWRAVSKVSRFELRSKVLIYQAPSYNGSQAPVVATSQKPRSRKWRNILSFFMLLVLIMSLITIGSLTLNKIVSITKLWHLVYKKILDKFKIAWKIRSTW